MTIFKDNLISNDEQQQPNRPKTENISNEKDLNNQINIEDKKIRHAIKKYAYIVGSIILLCVVLVYLYHILFPQNLRWLEPEEVSEIKNFAMTIIVGIVSALISSYFFHK